MLSVARASNTDLVTTFEIKIMQVPAWQITSWIEVGVKVAEWNSSVMELRHLGTSAHVDEGDDGLHYGQSLWGCQTAPDRMVGIAWDWREVRPGVVAMSDPMTVLSNVILIGEEGEPVDPFKRILHLNNAIFSLPWQAQACANAERLIEALQA